jgi:hypothetical protein
MASRALTLVSSDTGPKSARRGDVVDRDDGADLGFDLHDLVARFESSEDASQDAREQSQKFKKFYDGDQLDEEERAALRKRRQPEVETNLIKPKIDFLVGLEKQQRTKPKALPRSPVHEQDADACSNALNYVCEDQDFKMTRSAVWRDMLIYGTGGVEVSVKDYGAHGDYSDPNEICIEIKRYRWDRLFVDPHSFETDHSDASYLGAVVWMDFDNALAMFPGKRKALQHTLDEGPGSDTYDDKPVSSVWVDQKRKRIRIVKMWICEDEQWYDFTFTKGGILNGGKSPFVTDDGYSDGGMVLQSSYIDGDGKAYSPIKQFVSPQQEYNKRSSKSLHLLNTTQILGERGAVDNVEKTRQEAGRPDGYIEVAPGALAEQRILIRERTDLAAGHIEMMKIAREAIQLMGPNATLQGDQKGDPSGRAILASQQGGMIELGSLLDDLRHFDRRVYRMIWNRIRQYWSGQRWIRVTDDERNVKFAALNEPAKVPVMIPGTGEQIMIPDIDPATGQQRIENNIIEADVDIYIDDVQDVVAPQIEAWQALVELKKVDVNNQLPFTSLIKAAPNIRNRDQILEEMEQAAQAQQQAQQGPTPEQLKLQAQQQSAEMAAQAKAQDHQQSLIQGEQAHKQKLVQTEQEHQQQLALEERQAAAQERIQIRQAQLQEHTQARKAEHEAELQRRQQDFDIAGEARKQEVSGFYEGQKHRQSMQVESDRDARKTRAEEDAVERKRRAETQAHQEREKPKVDAVAGLEKQFSAIAKAMEGLGATIKAMDDGNRQHRDAVAGELRRFRDQRAKKGN